jgi:GTP-binding nuclear protein Ran
MFDMTKRETYENIPKWHSKLVSMCGNIPIILAGNKVDANNREVKYGDVRFYDKKNLRAS